MYSYTIAILFIALLKLSNGQTPVVMWHGMGDSCCEEGSLRGVQKLIEDNIPNIYVLSLRFGNDTLQDIESTYFSNANDQIQYACDTIASDPKLQNGYNGLGFSQGGQFMRAVAQRCPYPAMKQLITLGAQHQGVYGLPHCGQPEPTYCDLIRKLLNHAAYAGWLQDTLIQAQYWHDPLDEEKHRQHSIFIAEINNEKDVKNMSYSENLQKLEKIVLVLFEEDGMVTPRESSWFGFYAAGQGEIVLSYQNTTLYQEDLIGLKAMNEAGKVDFYSVKGDHLQFTQEWFNENIIDKYLKL